jgi:tetrahydromethanopterin S-methyltransferase subunit G
MPSDVDSLVVAHLREIHAELQGIRTRLDEHDRRLDRVGSAVEGLRPVVEHTLSLVTMSQIGLGKVESHHDAVEAWQRGANQRLDWIERRLSSLAQKLGA